MHKDPKPTTTETINLGYEQLLVFAPDGPGPSRVVYRGIALSGTGDGDMPGRRAGTEPRSAPRARLCLNTSPGDSAEAVQRWI